MSLGSFQDGATVRVSPGSHQLEFSAVTDEYAAQTHEVEYLRTRCETPDCNVLRPTRETQIGLVPVASRSCKRQLELEVAEGAEALALFVVRPGGECESCVREDLDARRCRQ